MFGGVSEMTIWRWMRSETVQFPLPVTIAGKNYWSLGDLRRFRERCAHRDEAESASIAQRLKRRSIKGDAAWNLIRQFAINPETKGESTTMTTISVPAFIQRAPNSDEFVSIKDFLGADEPTRLEAVLAQFNDENFRNGVREIERIQAVAAFLGFPELAENLKRAVALLSECEIRVKDGRPPSAAIADWAKRYGSGATFPAWSLLSGRATRTFWNTLSNKWWWHEHQSAQTLKKRGPRGGQPRADLNP
jgi:hypothetical protein